MRSPPTRDGPHDIIGERSEEASRAASSLVWSKRDDGSSTLISVPFNVDGTRGEAPQDAEEWISEDATLGVGIGIFALYVLGLACYLRRSPPFVGRGRTVRVTLREPLTLVCSAAQLADFVDPVIQGQACARAGIQLK